MSIVFKSKIGLELLIPLLVVFGTVLFLTIFEPSGWIGIAILSPVILFVVHMFMTTYYVIKENSLIIKCGFLYNKTVSIDKIIEISETNNPISSPATSLDRIEIRYEEFNTVIISPKKKKEFIREIIKLNPSIEVKFRE
jgi:hypothetical protein